MADLVSHDAGDFALGLGRLDHAAIHEHRAARERRGVDLPDVDDVECVAEFLMLQLARDRADQSATQPLDIRLRFVVVQDRQLLAHFLRRLLTEFHVLSGRVFVVRGRDPRLRGDERAGHDQRGYGAK